jgi:hypothetical protein
MRASRGDQRERAAERPETIDVGHEPIHDTPRDRRHLYRARWSGHADRAVTLMTEFVFWMLFIAGALLIAQLLAPLMMSGQV